MKLRVEVSDKLLADMLSDAGAAIRYWADDIQRLETLKLRVHEQDGREEYQTVDKDRLALALGLMAQKCPKRFGRLLGGGDYDSNDVDLLIQYACFGEAKYG